jgi:hypothetical protein
MALFTGWLDLQTGFAGWLVDCLNGRMELWQAGCIGGWMAGWKSEYSGLLAVWLTLLVGWLSG